MPSETTLILLKTDCVTKKLCGEVLRRFEAEGFQIRGLKMMTLSEEILREHYAHIEDRPFFPEVVAFMQASPVVALALEADDAVARVRDLLGPTDSTKADKGTIAGDFGEDMMKNICHASDAVEAAEVELKRFFAPGEVFSY